MISDDTRGRRIADLSHAEKDREGLFATRIREEEYRARRRARWSFYGQRFSDLTKVLNDRVGPLGLIPEGIDDAEAIIRCYAYHFNARPDVEDVEQRLNAFCFDHCDNWTDGWPEKGDVISPILAAVSGRRRDLRALEVGRELNVTWDDRCRLGLRTIAACDLTPEKFAQRAKARKQEADRERQRAERRRQGAISRAEYEECSVSRAQPWIAKGISRATYYRKMRETSPSQLGEASNDSDGLVSRSGWGKPSLATIPSQQS